MTALRTLRSAAFGLAASTLAIPVALAQIQTGDSSIGVPKSGLREAVVKIINFVLTFVGLIAVAMLIYGGFLYLTSGLNEENLKKAKSIILYAIIGIVVITLSWVIVNAIIGVGDVVGSNSGN